MAVFLDKLTFR